MFSLILERFPNYFVLSKIAFISTNQKFSSMCLGKLAKVIKFFGKFLKNIKNLIFLTIIEHVRKKQCVKSKP